MILDSSDEILCKLASRGDKEAMQAIYTRYYSLMLNFGLKYCDDAEIVRDCIQDMFLKLLCHPSILGSTRSLRSYLLISLRNQLFDFMRNHEQKISLEDLNPQFVDLEEFLQFESEGISDEEVNERKRLMMVLKELNANQRMALYLHYVRDLSHKEISDILDINPQSSMNLLYRSLTKLRKLLKLMILMYL